MKTLKDILDNIQYETRETIEEVAKSIGYSRPYLNNAVNNGGNDKIKARLLDYLKNVKKSNNNVSNETVAPKETSPQSEYDGLNIKELINLAKYKLGWSVNTLAEAIGYTRSHLSLITDENGKLVRKRLIEFLNEKGITNDTQKFQNPEIVKAPIGKFEKKSGFGLVKFYDTDFAAGDTAFRTYGESMEPAIKSGSILFATKVVDWQSHLEYGQIYGIVCHDKRKYLKYIRKDVENPKANIKTNTVKDLKLKAPV